MRLKTLILEMDYNNILKFNKENKLFYLDDVKDLSIEFKNSRIIFKRDNDDLNINTITDNFDSSIIIDNKKITFAYVMNKLVAIPTILIGENSTITINLLSKRYRIHFIYKPINKTYEINDTSNAVLMSCKIIEDMYKQMLDKEDGN
jgi:hypothetical protein